MFQYFPERDVAVATLGDEGPVLLLPRVDRPAPGSFCAVDQVGRDRTQEAVDAGLRTQFLLAADEGVAGLDAALDAGDDAFGIDEEDRFEEVLLVRAGVGDVMPASDRYPEVGIDPAIGEEERWSFAACVVSYRNRVNEDPSATAEAYDELFVHPSLDGWLRTMRALHLLPARGLQQRSPWMLSITADEVHEGGVWDGNLLRMSWREISDTAILALGPDGYVNREDYERAQNDLADQLDESDRMAGDVIGALLRRKIK